MVDSFDRLRHYTVVCSYNEDSDIGELCTSCSHRGERFVTRGVEECYLTALESYGVSTDLLCDTAGFAFGYVGRSDLIEE